MHLPKLSLGSRPPLFISSKRRSTAFHPSFPPDVLSRNRRLRSPICALDCIRVIFPGRIPSGTFIDTRDANCRTPDASLDGCFISPRANPGPGGGLPIPGDGCCARLPPSTVMPSSDGRWSPYPAMPRRAAGKRNAARRRPAHRTTMRGPPAGCVCVRERERQGKEEGDRDGG
jgi:hypothetical protein